MYYLKIAITSIFLPIFFSWHPPTAQANPQTIIINEVHYDAVPKTEPAEFIELYNNSADAVDLSGWSIEDGIRYTIPDGITLAPSTYLIIAQQPDVLRNKYGLDDTVPVLGSYDGRLSSKGENLTLRDVKGTQIDELEYDLGFPWPVVNAMATEESIGLLHPQSDNSHPGSWRSGTPTPGMPNAVQSEDPLPLISEVKHVPQVPRSDEAVTITARVTSPMTDSIDSVILTYQLVEPGSYIHQQDPLYKTQWLTQKMDLITDDNNRELVFTAQLTSTLQTHRRLIRYRIQVESTLPDNTTVSIQVPYPDDPQPNFAYFVYDGVPSWIGAINPADPDDLGELVVHDFEQMEPAPVYHFIAHSEDVDAALFERPRGEGYKGNEYKWQGTLVYNGIVYDHLPFRARGGFWRYAMGKNMWKFNFARGHRFQAYDQDGQPYSVQWDKLNLGAIIQQGFFEQRGEQGLFESVSYRLFQLAGVPASDTHYVHFRVIDGSEESTESQYEGDFWGLYLAVEQVDGRFLDANNLPDGNLYKMDREEDSLSNQGRAGVTDGSDLLAFLTMYEEGEPDEAWWRANFDLAGYYSYRAIVEAIHHYDIGEDKNYFYYLNPDNQIWSVLPWDVDLTWDNNMYGTGREPFKEAVLEQPIFQLEYQNRLREIRDLLYNPEQIALLIDEYVNRVDRLDLNPSLVDADRAMWDYNPVMASDYVREDRSRTGRFYESSPTGDFRGMAQKMKEYVEDRISFIDKRLLDDREHPKTPTISYAGPEGYPDGQLNFVPSAYQGKHGFAGIQWRTALVTDPAAPDYDPLLPPRYEITAYWQSQVLAEFVPEFQLPLGACPVDETCRVRVRVQDSTGRWSHWSAPIQLRATPPIELPLSELLITEIMYHPQVDGQQQEEDYEFVELTNLGERTLDLSGMRFSDGIEYTFPISTLLEAGDIIVLVNNDKRFIERYGFAPFGQYQGKLSNKGERLALVDGLENMLYSVTYDDTSPWPPLADGFGYSLVPRITPYIDDKNPDDALYWRRSLEMGGSPGRPDILSSKAD